MSSRGRVPALKATEAIVIAVTRALGHPVQLPSEEIRRIIEDFFEEERERLSRKVKEVYAKHRYADAELLLNQLVVAVRGFDGVARRNAPGKKYNQ